MSRATSSEPMRAGSYWGAELRRMPRLELRVDPTRPELQIPPQFVPLAAAWMPAAAEGRQRVKACRQASALRPAEERKGSRTVGAAEDRHLWEEWTIPGADVCRDRTQRSPRPHHPNQARAHCWAAFQRGRSMGWNRPPAFPQGFEGSSYALRAWEDVPWEAAEAVSTDLFWSLENSLAQKNRAC